jgi:heme-degrading monooxygenase HmoA
MTGFRHVFLGKKIKINQAGKTMVLTIWKTIEVVIL